MATPVRRAAARPAPAVQQSGGSVNFLDDSFYLGGLGLPEGDYALEFSTAMFQPTKQNGQPSGQAFLAVMITCHPIGGGEPSEHPLGCGRNAHKSFVPSSDGKGFDPVAGGSSIGINDMTNWSIFRKSFRDCGAPPASNDLSIYDGVWVHTQNIPEPEERKAFRTSQTGEAALQAEDATQGPKVCVVVSEILKGGEPWNGGGGIPVAGEAVATPGPHRVAPAAKAPVTRGRVAPPDPAPVEEAAVSDEDIASAAMSGATEHLSKAQNAKGCTKLALRTGTFSAVSKAQGEDMANAVLEMYFGSDEALNTILGELGYVSLNGQIKVM